MEGLLECFQINAPQFCFLIPCLSGRSLSLKQSCQPVSPYQAQSALFIMKMQKKIKREMEKKRLESVMTEQKQVTRIKQTGNKRGI